MRYTIGARLVLATVGLIPLVAQQPARPSNAQKATGSLPDGWKVRLDDPQAKPDAVSVVAEKDSVTITSGPAGIYYKPNMKAEKDYEVTATFSQLKPSTPPVAYGLFVAGADLDKDVPRHTAFLIRQNGQYEIVSQNADKPTVIVDWRAASAMADPKGMKTTNTLTIRAVQDTMHFLIGEKEVHQMPRARAGGDGIAGVRIGPNLNVQVNKLSVKKLN
jgi:hypothetical protein